MRTSYSALETYLQCPRKYAFQELEHVRVPKSKEALFGTLIHRTLRFMFERDPLFPTLDEVLAFFRKNWPDREIWLQESRHDPLKRAWSEEEQHIYLNQGIQMLTNFYKKNSPWNYSVVDLESRFEVTLQDPQTGKTHILAGIMDRIDRQEDGTYEIIDYKTSKRMPSQASLHDNLQLSLYALGLQKRWPHLDPAKIALTLYFLKHQESLHAKPTQESLQKTEEKVAAIIREIEAKIAEKKEFEPVPTALCNWCNFRPMCPAWQHLYRKDAADATLDEKEIAEKTDEYLTLLKDKKEKETRIKKLQQIIASAMESKGLTRVFGSDGYLTKKTQQRYSYDLEKVKALLTPLGKWEEILTADATKLKKILSEIPEDIRAAIAQTRMLAKEFTVITPSLKSVTEKSKE